LKDEKIEDIGIAVKNLEKLNCVRKLVKFNLR